ncbi:unnamed protein product [Pieris macdunnoughi]|uniref:Uncharacterized protein n=1 Tax=Pieris macdunnoughi TaxID=345717 RepID=A0A821XKZ0_9NEOP|nr:unnamed protein product [Pieris macdunnoughi]
MGKTYSVEKKEEEVIIAQNGANQASTSHLEFKLEVLGIMVTVMSFIIFIACAVALYKAVGSLATHRATDDTIHPPAALPASETSRRGTELQAVRVTSAGHASNDATRPFAPPTASETSQPTISARDPSVALHRAPTDALFSASSTRNSESDIENMSAANIGPTPNYRECSSVDELLIMLDRDPGPGTASSPRTAYESDLIFLAQSFACSFASRGMLRAMARYAKTREEALRNSGALQSPLSDAEQRELAQVRNECRLPARTPATPVRRPFSAVDPGSEDILLDLYEGNTSDANHFKANIRQYNSIYIKTGSLVPLQGHKPQYNQLYIIEDEAALNDRLSDSRNNMCRSNIMRSLQTMLNESNPFIKIYKKVAAILAEEELKAASENRPKYSVSMQFYKHKSLDLRRYNTPSKNEVAAIFVGENGEPPLTLIVILYSIPYIQLYKNI